MSSFFQMPFPPKKHAIGRKSISSVSTEMSSGGDAAVGEGGAADFWPVQQPIAPPPGDKPVQCPFPHSSLINEWRGKGKGKGAEPMSKRRHSVSHAHEGDHYRRLLFPLNLAPAPAPAPASFTFNKF